MPETPYLPGSKVFLNKAGTRHGYVISHHLGTPEDRYDIIVAGEERPRQFYASQIYPPAAIPESHLSDKRSNSRRAYALYNLIKAVVHYVTGKFLFTSKKDCSSRLNLISYKR